MLAQLVTHALTERAVVVAHHVHCRCDLFPPRKDPHSAPIRNEELRALVRRWNLHHERHFWRNHPTKDDVVSALTRCVSVHTADVYLLYNCNSFM
jgi:hypothetical protein